MNATRIATPIMAAALVLISSSTRGAAEDGSRYFEHSVVQVIATCQEHDPAFPWRRNAPFVREGYAVAIGGGRLITTEYLVRNHTLVEVRAARSGVKVPATVILADFRQNLALLDVSGSRISDELIPVDIAAEHRADEPLTIVQFDDTGQLQTSSGRISEISMYDVSRSDVSVLAAHILTDMTLTGHGGTPVFNNGSLFGLSIRYDRQAKKCYVLPWTVLARFIDDSALSPYPGAPTAGFLWEPLIDPNKRAYLGLSKHTGGVAVLRTFPKSGSPLAPEDAIIEWDGVPIDSQGYYEDPDFGRLLFSYLVIKNRRPGDVVPATIIRGGRRMNIEIELAQAPAESGAIPLNSAGEQPEYLLDGGLLLLELTLDYLETRGPRWPSRTDPKLLHLYLKRFQVAETPGRRVVLLSLVLPDPINAGYEELSDVIVSAVNGEPVMNLSDVFRAVDREGGLRSLALETPEIEILLDPERLDEANRRISRSYNVPRLRHMRDKQ